MPRSTTNMSLRDLLVVVLAAVGILAWGCSGVTLNRRDTPVVTPVAATATPDGPLDVTVTPPALTAPVSSTATWVADITPMSPPVVVSDETPTPTPVGRDTVLTPACTNTASLLTDVTMPDGAQVAAGAGFNKIWRIRNTGSCTWENDY